MQSKVKLTRREIKDDKFTSFVLQSKDQLADYWQYLAIGALVLVLVIVGIVYFINSQQSGSTEASAALTKAITENRTGNRQLAMVTLGQLIEAHSGTPAGRQARLMLANLQLESRNYPEAQKQYEQFLSQTGSPKLQRAAALSGIACVLENQGQHAEAAQKYLAAADEDNDGAIAPEQMANAIRAFQAAGDEAKAKELLDRMVATYPQSAATARAIRLMAEKGYVRTGP